MTNEQIQSAINSLQYSIDMLQSILDGTNDSMSRDEVIRDVASSLYYDYRNFSIYNL